MDQKLIELMADLKEEETLTRVRELVEAKTNPLEILAAARAAMEIVGKRFETFEYFIPDLVMAGEILTAITAIVKPLLTGGGEGPKKGRVLIATVEGDIHDIGKDIVVFMLDVSGYEVLDLGIDVPIETVVGKTREFKPQVVGLSAFLTLAFDSMKNTIEAIEGAGLRKNLKIMIGGGQIDEEIRQYVRADAYGRDAIAAVNFCKEWIGA
ncbi:MAG: cobalamin B12-binding domain-containing protein [Deltaproteobacteria bacterium]|nr:cobalamin B12-binding domain-containing protein [Deltaproteobacteria bacterium]